MHSEPAIENRAVFVDNSGRRSKLLRRIGVLVGVVCLGYAVVLGMAFMGIGTSINPSSLVPFAGGGGGAGPGGRGGNGPAGYAPQGGIGGRAAPPSGAPSVPPTSTATPADGPTATSTPSN